MLRLNRSRRFSALVVSASVAVAKIATANVIFDLRFAPGVTGTIDAHSAYAVDNASYAVELWVRVSGTDGNVSNEGVTFNYPVIMSSQSNGGAIITGGLANGECAAPFNNPTYSRNGTGSDLNGDGIIDWGSTSTDVTALSYMRTEDIPAVVVFGGGTVGEVVDANTWEFKIATYNINIQSHGTGITQFRPVKPNYTAILAATYSAPYVDNAHFNISSVNQQGAYTNSLGITFDSLPEPAIAIPAAAIALLSRRKRSG